MRRVVTCAMVAASLVPMAQMLHAQAGAGKPPVGACSLLTKEVVAANTPYDKKAFGRVSIIPPNEDAVGKAGSSCSYGGVHMQIDPFSLSVIENQRQADAKRGQPWAVVTGVGEIAYFRDNRGRYGELFTRVGTRIVTIQMSVPDGRTTESIKPNAVALAQAIAAKLR